MEKEIRSEPLETFMGVLSYACCFSDTKRRWPQPGAVIERMGQQAREALSRLKSNELEKVRTDTLKLFIVNEQEERQWVFDPTFQKYGQTLAEQRHKNGQWSRLKMSFDRKLRPNWA